jgi:hypothetical protein
MKFTRILSTVILLFLVVLTAHADDVTADNLTVQQSATIAGVSSFGTVYTGVTVNDGTAWGFHLDVVQASAEVPQEITHSSTIEGYNQWQWVTVDEYDRRRVWVG